MHNGNVQQNPPSVESCVTKEFSISPRFPPTIFDPDANSVLLRAHLCTAVDSMRRKPCVRNCSREREGLYNGNVQQNPLYVASCLCSKNLRISPRFSPTIFYRDANSVLLLANLCTAVLIGSMPKTLCSKLFTAHPFDTFVSPSPEQAYLAFLGSRSYRADICTYVCKRKATDERRIQILQR